ncbi:DUF1707 and DUF4190 domain-containing protein [Streptomyces sp. NRRL S-37]|uniref:DUF1707 and DUF4190 domain-containing protein n=1 Tax=Streptomyces sp. NRRL S-37 TaxID=1463903 RepID=UPI0004C9A9A8|nr:DUF1707 and DUF4190 domain-containing protein [Streptomyces sp. NRRL S-37]
MSYSPYPQGQPWQQGHGVPQPWPGQPWAGWAAPPMLASHADRERAVDVLRAGYGEGRLEKPEFDRRAARAYAARTVGELALLVADLPQGPVPHAVPAVPAVFRPVPRVRVNGKAVASAVCGGLCLVTFGLTGIPAVILGHAARAEIARTGEEGDGLALTGLALGWLANGAWVVLMLLSFALALASG